MVVRMSTKNKPQNTPLSEWDSGLVDCSHKVISSICGFPFLNLLYNFCFLPQQWWYIKSHGKHCPVCKLQMKHEINENMQHVISVYTIPNSQ